MFASPFNGARLDTWLRAKSSEARLRHFSRPVRSLMFMPTPLIVESCTTSDSTMGLSLSRFSKTNLRTAASKFLSGKMDSAGFSSLSFSFAFSLSLALSWASRVLAARVTNRIDTISCFICSVRRILQSGKIVCQGCGGIRLRPSAATSVLMPHHGEGNLHDGFDAGLAVEGELPAEEFSEAPGNDETEP